MTSRTAVTGPAGIEKTRLTFCASTIATVTRHPITSSRSVAAIGSVDTIRIGYSAAMIAVADEKRRHGPRAPAVRRRRSAAPPGCPACP